MAVQASANEEIDVIGYTQEYAIIKGTEQLNQIHQVNKGDHIIHCVTKPPYRPMFQSVLVTNSSNDRNTLSIIRNYMNGIEEKEFDFKVLQFPYKVIYDCTAVRLFDSDTAIQQARERRRLGETDHYCPLFNNSHHFVMWSKTGNEYPLRDIIQSIERHVETSGEYFNDSVSGDSDHDELLDYYSDDSDIQVHQQQDVSTLALTMSDLSINENEDQDTNSDREDSELQTSDGDTDTSSEASEDPSDLPIVLQKKKTESINDVSQGDHIMEDSNHWLVKSVNDSKFSGYTVTRGTVKLQSKSWNKNMFSIIYPQQDNTSSAETLTRAETEMNSKLHSDSDRFVTKMKCGNAYSIDESCLIDFNAKPVSCSLISVDTKVAIGDHLLVKHGEQYSSVIVCSLTGKSTLTVLPIINEQPQIVVKSTSNLYRVNYSEHLPPTEAVKRATSDQGEALLQNCQLDTSRFVSWAIIGKQISVDTRALIENQQIKQVTPVCYKCINTLDEIQPGDHLFVPYPTYRWHFIVTECKVQGNPTAFNTVYCLRGLVKEKVEILDPNKKSIFKVLYSEQLPAEKAIERAQSMIGSHKHQLLARVDFVCWAKTGSKDGLEVDFLTNISAPISKERINCFAQLNPGDYLVVEEGKAIPYHHYLVISVQSATECRVVESWRRSSPTEKRLILTKQSCYKLMYRENVCRPLEESVRIAEQFCQSKWTFIDSFSRQTFINFLKTGDFSHRVDVNSLRHTRLELRTELVTDATQLCKGDHIVRPLDIGILGRLPMLSGKNHHIIVFDPEDSRNCSVIEAQVKSKRFKKGKPVHHSIDIFKDTTAVYRVLYTERIDPERGMHLCMQEVPDEDSTRLSGASAISFESDDENDDTTQMCQRETDASESMRYNLFNNNCEHVAMLATIGRRLSIQVSKELYDDLNTINQRIATPMVVHGSDVLARNSSKGVIKATGKIVGSVVTRAAARAAVKGGITGGAAESTETSVAGALSSGFKLGYPAAITGASLGIVSGVAVVANAGIEGPMLVRGLYKLHRKKKFKKISKQAFKRGVTRTTITRVSTFIGGSGGALLGQVIIPVPVLGAVVGGIAGTVTGKVAGHYAGTGIANRAFREKIVDLPIIVSCEYKNISDLAHDS